MNTDDDLRIAMELGARLVVIQVGETNLRRAGTRSQATAYTVQVERLAPTVKGASEEASAAQPASASQVAVPSGLVVCHFGPPLLEPGRRYGAGIANSGRHGGAWEIRLAEPIGDSNPDVALAALVDRARNLDSARR